MLKELLQIQQNLNAPKNKYNKFGKYAYRSCEGILEALKPLLKEFGCTLIISDDVLSIGDGVYIKATATLYNADGDSACAIGYAREEPDKKGMDSAQVTGSTSSYARKYALNGLFCIDDSKDADELNVKSATDTGHQELKQAMADLSAANSLDAITDVWKKWKGTAPHLCTPGTPFFKAVKLKSDKLKIQ